MHTSSVYLLGARIDCLHRQDLLDLVVRSVRYRRRQTILYVNAHCMNVQSRDRAYHDVLADADIVYCDGVGVLLAARFTGQTIPERMTGADWIEDLCRAALQHDLSLSFLGGTPDAVQGSARTLRARYPGLRLVGAQDGYHVGPDTAAAINRQRPDVLLVGLGVPPSGDRAAAALEALPPGKPCLPLAGVHRSARSRGSPPSPYLWTTDVTLMTRAAAAAKHRKVSKQ